MSILDSINAAETAESFGKLLDQDDSVIDGVRRDIAALEDDYTIELPAQHAVDAIALHKSNSEAARIRLAVERDIAEWDRKHTCDRFE